MLARAHAAMHQWKEAQGELLRVVKVDRSNRTGFALLGEVLLRRSDYERAVPVLQHAQNLDPTSPAILSMLKRARSGQALDPPAPIPTPVPPRGETDANVEIDHRRSVPAMGQQPVPTASPQALVARRTPCKPRTPGGGMKRAPYVASEASRVGAGERCREQDSGSFASLGREGRCRGASPEKANARSGRAFAGTLGLCRALGFPLAHRLVHHVPADDDEDRRPPAGTHGGEA